MDFSDQIAPFEWIEYDGTVSVTLYTSNKYKRKLFKTRKKEGFTGSGYDWEALAQVYIQEKIPELQKELSFDTERGMFCIYSSNAETLRHFIIGFAEACENDAVVCDLFSRAKPEEPITKEDIKKVFEEMGFHL